MPCVPLGEPKKGGQAGSSWMIVELDVHHEMHGRITGIAGLAWHCKFSQPSWHEQLKFMRRTFNGSSHVSKDFWYLISRV